MGTCAAPSPEPWPNALIVLRAKYPRLTIKLVTASGVTKHLALDVVNRKIDASFGVGPIRLPEELLLATLPPGTILRRLPPKGSGARPTKNCWREGPTCGTSRVLLEETMIDREMKRRGIKAEPIMELDSYNSILLMVEHDVGIGVVPDSYLPKQKFAKLHCVAFRHSPADSGNGPHGPA